MRLPEFTELINVEKVGINARRGNNDWGTQRAAHNNYRNCPITPLTPLSGLDPTTIPKQLRNRIGNQYVTFRNYILKSMISTKHIKVREAKTMQKYTKNS